MFYCDVGVIQCLFLLFVCAVALAMWSVYMSITNKTLMETSV